MNHSSSSQVVLACHITGVFDVNRASTLQDNHYALVEKWANSIRKAKLQGVIFHNNFSKEICNDFSDDFITFVEIDYNKSYNPNVYRYFVYDDFLSKNKNIEAVFVTDVSDVEVINNPFVQPLFVENPSFIFCGDEPKQLQNEWMYAHATHLRNQIAEYATYEDTFKNETLLNCGIFGGCASVMHGFVRKLCEIHQKYNQHNATAYTGDMGAFNYLVRKGGYNERVIHGSPINTVFKAYDQENDTCWFRHK